MYPMTIPIKEAMQTNLCIASLSIFCIIQNPTLSRSFIFRIFPITSSSRPA